MKNRVLKGILYTLGALAAVALILTVYLMIPLKGKASTEIWDSRVSYDPSGTASLSMDEGEDFKILVLADIQLESDPVRDRKALRMIRELVEKSDPDFIMTVGDNTTWIFGDNRARKVARTLGSFDIPWGVVLGNHDGEGRADRTWHGNMYEEAPNSLFSSGPSNIHGIGNYAVNVLSPAGDIVYSLIMMDSNRYREYPDGKDYDFIYYDQIKWYEWMVQGLQAAEGKVVPTMAFFHIPLPEFAAAVDEFKEGRASEGSFGGVREDVFCPPVNSGLFDSMKALGSTTHIFNGHDHVNHLSLDWEGIRMTYVLKTGPASYNDDDLQGGTLVTIRKDSHRVDVEHLSLY